MGFLWIVDVKWFGFGFILMFLYCVNLEMLKVEMEFGYWSNLVVKYFFFFFSCVLKLRWRIRWWNCRIDIMWRFIVFLKFMMFVVENRCVFGFFIYILVFKKLLKIK